MESEIIWKGYKFTNNQDEFEPEAHEFYIYDPAMGHTQPVFYLKIKGLWMRNEGNNFGDYYQETMDKFIEIGVNMNISYAALLHEFIRCHSNDFPFIKNIFSSSLKGHKLEQLPSVEARRFWKKQLFKNIGVEFDGERYKMKINE